MIFDEFVLKLCWCYVPGLESVQASIHRKFGLLLSEQATVRYMLWKYVMDIC